MLASLSLDYDSQAPFMASHIVACPYCQVKPPPSTTSVSSGRGVEGGCPECFEGFRVARETQPG